MIEWSLIVCQRTFFPKKSNLLELFCVDEKIVSRLIGLLQLCWRAHRCRTCLYLDCCFALVLYSCSFKVELSALMFVAVGLCVKSWNHRYYRIIVFGIAAGIIVIGIQVFAKHFATGGSTACGVLCSMIERSLIVCQRTQF